MLLWIGPSFRSKSFFCLSSHSIQFSSYCLWHHWSSTSDQSWMWLHRVMSLLVHSLFPLNVIPCSSLDALIILLFHPNCWQQIRQLSAFIFLFLIIIIFLMSTKWGIWPKLLFVWGISRCCLFATYKPLRYFRKVQSKSQDRQFV